MQSKEELRARKAEQRAEAMRESLLKRKAQIKERKKIENEENGKDE
jgi:hypothetical protein